MTHIGSFQTVRQTSKEYMSTRTGFKILTSPFLPSKKKKKTAITRCVPNHYSFLGRIVINLCTCGDRNSYPTRFFSRGKGVLSRNVCFVTVMVVTAHMIDFFFFLPPTKLLTPRQWQGWIMPGLHRSGKLQFWRTLVLRWKEELTGLCASCSGNNTVFHNDDS